MFMILFPIFVIHFSIFIFIYRYSRTVMDIDKIQTYLKYFIYRAFVPIDEAIF